MRPLSPQSAWGARDPRLQRIGAGTCLGLLLLVGAMRPAAGGESLQPFLNADQNPFIQVYSPPPPQSARLVRPGAWRIALQLDLTSNSIGEGDSVENLVLDGETYRSALSLSYGLSDRLEAGIVVPYLMHRRGVFDNFIEDWHDTFGLSNRKRTAFARDQLDYAYTGSEASQQLDEPAEGLGDVRLTLGYPVARSEEAGRDIALHASLKLPSGDAAKLLGSEGTDLALQLSAVDSGLLRRWDATLFWSLGVLRLGDGEVLESLRRDYVAIGTLGLGRPVTGRISLKMQLDGHTSFYDSELAALGSNTVQLTVGGEIDLPGLATVDLGLVENLFTDTTPDLVFHLAWRTVL